MALVAIAVIVAQSEPLAKERERERERDGCDTLAGVVTRSWWTMDGDKKKKKPDTWMFFQ